MKQRKWIVTILIIEMVAHPSSFDQSGKKLREFNQKGGFDLKNDICSTK